MSNNVSSQLLAGGDSPPLVSSIPRATYRLQFNRNFTFRDAKELVPYLAALGISHCYASPYLKARSGSAHGYDIVDHCSLNPEIGRRQDFEALVIALQTFGMGQILDLVPNHMGVGGDDNRWWLDVLENGQASAYANFFDIHWRPLKEGLRGKVLLPILGNHYGEILKAGEIQLRFNATLGTFTAHYYNHLLPIDSSTYPLILERNILRLEERQGSNDPVFQEFKSLINSFQKLPSRKEKSPEQIQERERDKEIFKRRLAELVHRAPWLQDFIQENVGEINGRRGEPGTFNALHELLEGQAYRLSFWQVASHEINYRRFFDINDLAGLRMENPQVFETTHQFVFELISSGRLHGLRIDHPDGLYHPQQYYEQLRQRMQEIVPKTIDAATNIAPNAPGIYLVIEKILAAHEHLPEDWPVHGTTGYEYVNQVNGVFINPAGEGSLKNTYRRFLGEKINFDDLLYERKKLIIQVQLSSELNVLASALDAISEADCFTRDYTLIGLRAALLEVVACFPVYRTYVVGDQVSTEDRRYIDWAIAQAKKRSPAADISIFDFIRNVLLCQWPSDPQQTAAKQAVEAFAMKFQQYTAPVMAKGLEDTTFYIYNLLLSLNEVGGDPRRFCVSAAAFHYMNQERARRWPQSMLATSTHDTKRSEDVRMRVNVLSELYEEWRTGVTRWRHINKSKKVKNQEVWAPSANDEYLLYQTLLGAWPLEELDETALTVFRERMQSYMMKAVREAKVHTSWINPNHEYEAAVQRFVAGLLQSLDKNAFLNNFLPFQKKVSRFGLLNSLAQVTLKLTSPGVPDIYQGMELWDFSLVDPDNRRPVDYHKRKQMLASLQELDTALPQEFNARLDKLITEIEEGHIKLYMTWRLLQLRKQLPLLFEQGEYLALTVEGAKAEHVIAFARRYQTSVTIVVVGRWFTALTDAEKPLPINADVWADTIISVPFLATGEIFTDIFTKAAINAHSGPNGVLLKVGELLSVFPAAVLKREDTPAI